VSGNGAGSDRRLRSGNWFDLDDLNGFLHRSWLKTEGVTDAAFRGRPVIGICNSWSELTTCNVNLRDIATAVKRGVLQSGGFPVEFPVISLSEPFMKPTTMLYRNLMAMDVEESLRAHPLDGVVLLAGCDKTQPASLMGAASADIPAIVITSGPMLSGHWNNEELGSCSDCFRLYDQRRAGQLSDKEWSGLEAALMRSTGHCMTMGTASTMACVTEALGMGPPGGAAPPAVDSRRYQTAETAGRLIVDLVARGIRPSDIMTAEAFDNAIRVLHAIGGSTNAIIHLIAIAGRVGVELPLQHFDDLSESTPWLVNLKPSGSYLMEDFFYAGGVPAVMAELGSLIHGDALTVSGKTVAENIASASVVNREVISSRQEPFGPDGALVVLRGNLCPDGAVFKRTACDPSLLVHEGQAVVFESISDLLARIDDPDLEVSADSVLVLKNAGPVGAPGMPEWGHLPIPAKLLKEGVRDMVRISDARMSGTSYGAVVLHVAPESAIGGPLALVRDGDRIRLDVPARSLDLLVDEAELAERRRAFVPPSPPDERGYRKLFRDNVLQANEGCDFAFLRGRSPALEEARTYGS
jgi:L-arabonate dehydrase